MMAKPCPLYGKAIYADCLDCERKLCEKPKYDQLVIGIDQSYKNTGISLAADGKLLKVTSFRLSSYEDNSARRKALSQKLRKVLRAVLPRANHTICIIERVRLRSEGFLSIDYIKSIGALNAVVKDVCSDYSVPVYSVDTRCWKAQVVGTSKPQSNHYGVPPEKWPTVRWVIKQGFENSILVEVQSPRKTKGTFMRDGLKLQYNDDAADSAGIAMFGFLGEKDKLKEEK